MINIKVGNHNIELYDSIEELPMIRFHKYNKMILIDGGIGSDLSDFDGHIEKAMAYNKSKSPELANIELENLRQNIYFIQSELSPKHMAFAVLIKSIDGEEKTDLSPEGLQKVLDLFADVPNSELTAHSDAVKKKIDDELQLYYPNLFEDSSVKEYYDELRKRNLLMLERIIKGSSPEIENQIDSITIRLVTYNKPHVFSGTENAEIQHNKSFEDMNLLIAQHLHLDPKKFTVLEFYSSFERVKEMLKPQKKH